MHAPQANVPSCYNCGQRGHLGEEVRAVFLLNLNSAVLGGAVPAVAQKLGLLEALIKLIEPAARADWITIILSNCN